MHTFLALGDSYTIGEAVAESGRWPVQLVEKLRKSGIKISDPDIIATTGWTTAELQEAILQQKPASGYSLVSLLAGVNNQYRGLPVARYREEFEVLVQQATGFAGGNPAGVIIISIPDYGVTPFARDKDPAKIARELDEYNRINREIARQHHVKWFDITTGSKSAATDLSLTADDGLHPSERMYAQWVEVIFPYVVNLLRND